jgi:NAD(P)-dependent dehydrogenase (short-subunit alcohol dehydrogenase family)
VSPRDVAVVTGAAGGIGRAIAERFAADGYRLFMIDISPDVVDIARSLPDAAGAVVDITDHDSVRRHLESIAADARLAALVNCAGTCTRTGFESFSPEEWHRDINTNLTSTFFLCQAAVFPYMREQQYGRIVNIASVSGKIGGLGRAQTSGGNGRSGPAYAASKAGVINLTRWIAREVGHWNITCNVVAPGPIATPMTSGHEPNYEFGDAPIPRFGNPGEVADAVAYLAHPDRGYTTGACFHVDGGLVLA